VFKKLPEQRKLTRRISTTLGAVTLLLGIMVPPALADTKPAPPTNTTPVAVAPASTAAAPANCTAGNLCFWNNINYNDGPGRLSGTNASWFNFSHSTCPNGTWADCASSVYNNGNSCTARVWYLTNFGAPHLDIPRGTGYPNLTLVPTGLGNSWNDNIESNSWVC